MECTSASNAYSVGTPAKGALRTFLLQTDINSRQRKVLGLMLEGFSEKLTSSKYARIAKCSADKALRDIRRAPDGCVQVCLLRVSAPSREIWLFFLKLNS